MRICPGITPGEALRMRWDMAMLLMQAQTEMIDEARSQIESDRRSSGAYGAGGVTHQRITSMADLYAFTGASPEIVNRVLEREAK